MLPANLGRGLVRESRTEVDLGIWMPGSLGNVLGRGCFGEPLTGLHAMRPWAVDSPALHRWAGEMGHT